MKGGFGMADSCGIVSAGIHLKLVRGQDKSGVSQAVAQFTRMTQARVL